MGFRRIRLEGSAACLRAVGAVPEESCWFRRGTCPANPAISSAVRDLRPASDNGPCGPRRCASCTPRLRTALASLRSFQPTLVCE